MAKTIADLPDDILVEKFFDPLDLKGQLIAGRVCRRWRFLSHKCVAKRTSLDVEKLPVKVARKPVGRWPSPFTSSLQFLLPIVGGNLKELKFGPPRRYEHSVITNDQLGLIAQHCPNLTSLELKVTQETKALQIAKLRSLTQLTSFGFDSSVQYYRSDPNLSTKQQCFTELSHLLRIWPLLTSLELRWVKVLPRMNLPNLRRLVLADCNVSEFQLARICERCPNIVDIHIESCAGLFNFTSLVMLKNLEKLSLWKCDGYPEEDFKPICPGWPNLCHVSLYDEGADNDPMIHAGFDVSWLADLPQLQQLDADGPFEVIAVMPDCKELTSVSLVNFPLTTVEDLQRLTTGQPQVSQLNVDSMGIAQLRQIVTWRREKNIQTPMTLGISKVPRGQQGVAIKARLAEVNVELVKFSPPQRP